MLDGVLVTEWKLLCVRHEGRERASNGPGESVEAVDIVSKSGVPGSKYGLVVLMNVKCLGISIQMASSSKVFLYA
jgi:hypothetical protein